MVLGNSATHICLYISYDWFFNIVGELNSYNRDFVVLKLKVIIIWPVMDWNVHPQDWYFKTLTPNVSVFGDRDFMEEIKAKWGLKCGVL